MRKVEVLNQTMAVLMVIITIMSGMSVEAKINRGSLDSAVVESKFGKVDKARNKKTTDKVTVDLTDDSGYAWIQYQVNNADNPKGAGNIVQRGSGSHTNW